MRHEDGRGENKGMTERRKERSVRGGNKGGKRKERKIVNGEK